MLITLTIIGVIAALTIPNLLQKYQEETLKTAYKKTYSVLSNAYKTVITETGPLECNYIKSGNSQYGGFVYKDCQTLYKKLFDNALKVEKQCDNNALQNGCLPENGYKNAADVEMGNGMSEEDANNSHGGCAFVRDNYVQKHLSAVVLSDGQIVVYGPTMPIMFVDVNGKKGPNKWGYDMFEFNLWQRKASDTVITYGQTVCVISEKGGKTPQQMYNSVILNK